MHYYYVCINNNALIINDDSGFRLVSLLFALYININLRQKYTKQHEYTYRERCYISSDNFN